MNLFGVMDVSASALRAERVRAEVVASNMANAETTRTPDGGPYQRHHVVFEAEGGGSFQESLVSQMNGGSAAAFGSGLKSALGRRFRYGSERWFDGCEWRTWWSCGDGSDQRCECAAGAV